MAELPVNEPLEVRLDEPAGSLEALDKAASEEEVSAIAAKAIGEEKEAARCVDFLRQLAPDAPQGA